jgi:hypothetical protein
MTNVNLEDWDGKIGRGLKTGSKNRSEIDTKFKTSKKLNPIDKPNEIPVN